MLEVQEVLEILKSHKLKIIWGDSLNWIDLECKTCDYKNKIISHNSKPLARRTELAGSAERDEQLHQATMLAELSQ